MQGRTGSNSSTSTADESTPGDVVRRREGPVTLRGVVKFAATAAVLAMVADAVVAHAIFWQNDPYWTYWVTDTFLMATVFGLGTAWFGVGIGRGAVLTAVQTLVLTTYYWSFSPIGLPAHPEWLDLERTWITGLPLHFTIYYLGYLTALWLWRRSGRVASRASGSIASDAVRALVVGVVIVVALGVLQGLVLGDFPGATWFVVRLVILVPFMLLWWSIAGRTWAAAVGGGLIAAMLLAAYGHYLGPIGLPNTDMRLLAPDSPPAAVYWLSYREEFLVILPITVLVVVVVFVAASIWHGYRWTPAAGSRAGGIAAGVSIVALVSVGIITAGHTAPTGESATVTSNGAAVVEDGDYYTGELVPSQAQMRLVAEPHSTRNTPLPPHDLVHLSASVVGPDAIRYEVKATQAMIADPLARWGTAGGVDFELWNQGRSGIGSSLLPASHSAVIAHAVGDVSVAGDVVATGVPMKTITLENGGLELQVGDPQFLVPALPDGHLRVVWDQRDGGDPDESKAARYLFGAVMMASLLALALSAARAPGPRRPQTEKNDA